MNWLKNRGNDVVAVRRTIMRILVCDQMHMTRLILAVGSFTWAVLLLVPSDLFGNRATYKVMAQLGTEWHWGLLFLLHSTVALSTLTYNIRSRIALYFDALLGCLLWTGSTAACFAAHWPYQYPTFWLQLINYPAPAAMSGELWLSVASWWHLVRYLAEEEKEYEPRCDC